MFPTPKRKHGSNVHFSFDMGHVHDDEIDGDTRVSKTNAMGSRMVMMRDVTHIWVYRCRREQSWIYELP